MILDWGILRCSEVCEMHNKKIKISDGSMINALIHVQIQVKLRQTTQHLKEQKYQ